MKLASDFKSMVTQIYQGAEAVRILLIGMGAKPLLVTASDHPGSATLDGRVELIFTPVRSH